MNGQGANAFMQSFLEAFNTGQDRTERRDERERDRAFRQMQLDFQRDQQEFNNTFRQDQFNYQKQQDQYNRGVADYTRQANGQAYSGQLQGDAGIYGRDSRELESKYGFNPYGYVSPQAMNYQTPEQQRKTKIDTAATIAAINAKYSALGKTPKFDVIEDGTGNQKYIIKGNTIPTGWKVSKPAAVNINQGGFSKPVPTEKTRMLTIAESGQKGVTQAKDILFESDGTLNRSVVAALNAPFGSAASGLWGGEASQLYSKLRGALRDKLRLESGAVISNDEVDEEMKRYIPGIFDSVETAKIKLKGIEDVLNQYVKIGGRGVVSPQPEQEALQNNPDPLGIR